MFKGYHSQIISPDIISSYFSVLTKLNIFDLCQISDATLAAGTGLIELRRIEASREIAATLSKSRNVVYLPSGNNMLLGINPSFANNQ